MERRLRKQFMELNRAHEKQDRQRRDFTANVSHELKTPLTSVSGYAEILRDGLVRPEDTRRFAGNIYDESRRLISLVEDILKLSELDDGYQQLENRVPVDLFDLCAETLTRLQSAAESRGVRRSIEGDHVRVLGVAKILGEIVYNLCDNAIKSHHPGGTVTVSVGEQGGKVLLRVRDDGIGISPEEQHRVFERFYRVDKSHSQEIGGTGLGLSIVKHGAAYHDARIELESTPGEGSEFRLIFHKMEKTDP
jgi:two-component system phosphate regulon sensor histidine kinase PhoR